MRTRVDELDHWHSAHACHVQRDGDGDETTSALTCEWHGELHAHAGKAWRYAIVRSSYAFGLTVGPNGGQFALHRRLAQAMNNTEGGEPCDLLNARCMLSVDADSLDVYGQSLARVRSPANFNSALEWWATHARQGTQQQPATFWKELDKLARRWMRETKEKTTERVRCPRCGGTGIVKVSRCR